MLGLAPRYKETHVMDRWLIRVSPPAILKAPNQTLILTEDQHERFLKWRNNEGHIQDMLPDLTPGAREVLLTGLTW